MLKAAVVGLSIFATAGLAYGDEVDVHAGPGPAVVAPGASDSKTVVRDHEGGTGCESKTVHRENDEGDSKTVSKTDC